MKEVMRSDRGTNGDGPSEAESIRTWRFSVSPGVASGENTQSDTLRRGVGGG